MEPRSEPTNTVWSFPLRHRTGNRPRLPCKPMCVLCLTRWRSCTTGGDPEARLTQNSTTSSKPPSSDSPYKKPQRHAPSTTPAKRGETGPSRPSPGALAAHNGPGAPARAVCCGNTTFALTTPYHTHQVIELPAIAMEVTHWVLHQGWCELWLLDQSSGTCRTCHRLRPRFSASWGASPGHMERPTYRANVLRSVLQVPISLGAIQKVLDRVTQAIDPYYAVIAQQARQALVNYIDETPWYCRNALEWLWVMASERVAFYMIHPRRSKEAFAALIDDWEGFWSVMAMADIKGVEARQTCLAHLIRTGTGLVGTASSRHSGLWSLGTDGAATSLSYGHRPTDRRGVAGGMPGCVSSSTSITERQDDAGKFARRLLREMDSLWVFLSHHGVEPTTTGRNGPCALACLAQALSGDGQ